MFRKRLRPQWSPEQLAEIYATPHDHKRWGHGHWLRVEATIVLGTWMVTDFGLRSGADLSCGNGEILNRLPLSQRLLGDYASGYVYKGEIENTIDHIPDVDLFVCSETIEHLDEPEAVLCQIRAKSRYLLLSTPIGEDDLGNPEHLWGWDQEAVKAMLEDCGWEVIARNDLILEDTYSYQIFACR